MPLWGFGEEASLASAAPDGRGRCQGAAPPGLLTYSVNFGSPTESQAKNLVQVHVGVSLGGWCVDDVLQPKKRGGTDRPQTHTALIRGPKAGSRRLTRRFFFGCVLSRPRAIVGHRQIKLIVLIGSVGRPSECREDRKGWKSHRSLMNVCSTSRRFDRHLQMFTP